jgi:hypothetical protein
MNLLQAYVHRCHELDLFSQKRTQVRASRLLLCNLLCLGRKWITRIICMADRDQCDWTNCSAVRPGAARTFLRPWCVTALITLTLPSPSSLPAMKPSASAPAIRSNAATGYAIHFRRLFMSTFLWQGGAGNMPLRLIVIAPIPYRLSFHSRAFYRRPAYFLCDNLDLPLETLIQATIDRWQIEVNHRDEKQHIGLQHPQVWNERSVDRLPAFMVVSYSFLLLASLQAYGARRSDQYLRPAKWQRNRLRPSCLDLISLLRKQAFSHPELLRSLNIDISADQAAIKAAA